MSNPGRPHGSAGSWQVVVNPANSGVPHGTQDAEDAALSFARILTRMPGESHPHGSGHGSPPVATAAVRSKVVTVMA